jgi:A/G-specific adenine glycosylase
MTLAARRGDKKHKVRPERRNSRDSSPSGVPHRTAPTTPSPAEPAYTRGSATLSSDRSRAGPTSVGGGEKGAIGGGEPQAAPLLAWYDRHRRSLPWRAPPGVAADPYLVWLSEIMLQQTTVTAVAPYYLRFVTRFPSVAALAAADIEDVLKLWAGLGYYARARNLHACARAVAARGAFPDREEDLLALPGIGPYTAAAIAAIAFDRRASPVDGNVERVVARLFAIEAELPNAKPAIRELAARLVPDRRAGDFAQAMMDLGATICTPKAPTCVLCPFMASCAARMRGDAETFPRKKKKREGGRRRGAAFVAVRADGCVLVRRRAPKGLLGGMTEVPGTEWHADFDEAAAVAQAPKFARAPRAGAAGWRRIPGVVTHVFTHFPLELVVFAARLPKSTAPPDGMRWIAREDIAAAALPSVMRKVLAHALGTQPG